MEFCRDADLMWYEPTISVHGAEASQVKIAGTGNLDSTSFVIGDGQSFIDKGVQAGDILLAMSSPAVSYAIVSVDGPGLLTVSLLVGDIFGDNGEAALPVSGPPADDLGYVVRSFYLQRRVVSDLIGQWIIGQASGVTILNPDVLRRACALGTLEVIYNALSATAEEPEIFLERRARYGLLFREAMRQVVVELDTNGDGQVDVIHRPGALRLVRE